jgi:acetolactate synthase-1/2/3 large subunit
MNVARLLAQKLAENGVKYVFGIPGGPSIPYMEAFRSEGIDFILTSNEASAGIMADVTARLTGIPGICHATFGPGATNISTGVGEALLDRSPVIALTSEMPDEMINRTVQMNINHQKLFEPVTKATFRMNPDNASEVIDVSLKICREEYPGPVHIGLPSGVAEKEAVENAGKLMYGEKRNIVQNDLQNILPLLEWTRRPLLAVGLSAARLDAGSYLTDFLEKYPMPVVFTPMAKGLLPEDHPCYAGILFHSLSDYLEDIFDKTDLVIGLGYDQVEFNYESWLPDVPLLHFDIVKTDLPDRQNITRYTGTVQDWFSVLSNLNPGYLVFEKTLVKGVKDEMESVFEGFTNHFGPAAAMKILQEELPGDVILTVDVGSHLHLAGQYWKTRGKRNILMTNGWSGMGFGIPAALAAQLNMPDATVVCITGDGGFLMMAGELITAKRNNLPVIIVVFSDGELNLIKVKQSRKNLLPYGTMLYQGELFESERFLGVKVLNATSAETMRSSVIDALAMNEPVIINAVIDPEDYKWLIVKR